MYSVIEFEKGYRQQSDKLEINEVDQQASVLSDYSVSVTSPCCFRIITTHEELSLQNLSVYEGLQKRFVFLRIQFAIWQTLIIRKRSAIKNV